MPEGKVSIRRYDVEDGEMFIAARKRLGYLREYCPLCRTSVVSGPLALLIANRINVPNCVVHTACLPPEVGQLEELLRRRYEEYTVTMTELRRSGFHDNRED